MQLPSSGHGKVSEGSTGKPRVSDMYISKAVATQTKTTEAHGRISSALIDTKAIVEHRLWLICTALLCRLGPPDEIAGKSSVLKSSKHSSRHGEFKAIRSLVAWDCCL